MMEQVLNEVNRCFEDLWKTLEKAKAQRLLQFAYQFYMHAKIRILFEIVKEIGYYQEDKNNILLVGLLVGFGLDGQKKRKK